MEQHDVDERGQIDVSRWDLARRRSKDVWMG